MATMLMGILLIKHFIVDFLFQTEYQWRNKGIYMHPGGIIHAMLHGIATITVFVFYDPIFALFAGIADAVAHYHIDWAKVNITQTAGWESNKHNEFWILVGLDQLLHQLTYVTIVAIYTL